MAKMDKKLGSQGQVLAEGEGRANSNMQEEGPDLPDVFCSLGSLIVEGRLPTEGFATKGRGYYEGPHVELPGKVSRHKCSQTEYLCKKNENFRKHMLLLWQNNVPMSIEILMCSDCGVGQAKARSIEVTTVPEPGSILLEQWTVAVQPAVHGAAQITCLSLLQAVRSYLHFSQLSAWYSTTEGATPWNILIRITVPGEEFESKFTQPPEKHYFPQAGVDGKSIISVSVRSLPRTDKIPKVVCSHNQLGIEVEEDSKLEIAGSLAWREPADLRRSLVKTKLASSESLRMYPDCPGRLIKSDSMDSMLGDSLLDPPQCLSKMNPRRYQSPSRCGSPSLEAPEPLMGIRKQETRKELPYDQSAVRSSETNSPYYRLNRHDLMRRRDITLFNEPHPRLFHGPPKLSLPPRPAQTGTRHPIKSGLLGIMNSDQPSTSASTEQIVEDRMPSHCTKSGKHICQFEEELEEVRPNLSSHSSSNSSPSPVSNQNPCQEYYKQEELGAKQKGWTSRLGRTSTPYSRDSSSDSSQADPKRTRNINPFKGTDTNLEEPENQGVDVDLSQSEMYDVLQTLRSRSSPLGQFGEMQAQNKEDKIQFLKSPKSTYEEIFEPQNMRCDPKLTQVYRADITPSSIVIPSKQDKSGKLLEESFRPYNSRPTDFPNVIHSLRETSKYCSQTSSSSSDVSPLSPIYTQLFECEQVSLTPSPRDENQDKPSEFRVCEPFDYWDKSIRNIHSPSPCPLNLSKDYDDINVGDLCSDLENKCQISRKFQHEGALNDCPERTRSESERPGAKQGLKPLDLSFDDFEDNWSLTAESIESLNHSRLHLSEKRRNSNDDDDDSIPSSNKKNAFRKSFDSATSMVFQSRNGLPLTSSPAPMRRGIKFDFDCGINTPKDIKRALFEAQSPEESECGSPKKKKSDPRKLLSTSAPASISSNNLLGNFEESVLNGRLEPVSTVEGFTAEIGASGSFQPKHLTFPVTVFFYTLCENSNVASPYLGHINLGKKGYRIPSKGTIQLTLFNPLGTVVKMFVVMYDLSDMPPNSQTFLRQRTLYMPSDASDSHEDAQKWLRYLIHLRLASSKSGKIYLHTDVRMIIFRKSDLDTATDHESGMGFELRSFTNGPKNPKFSPRK